MRQTKTKEKSKKPKKRFNAHGYDISEFIEWDIPVRRDRETGRLVSTRQEASKKSR